MGKRRRNERAILANPAGPENFHYCMVHNNICTPYGVWPRVRTMLWHCKDGCRISRLDTILKPKPAIRSHPKRR